MSRVKDTVNFIHAWEHPDEVADEVEAELRFHVDDQPLSARLEAEQKAHLSSKLPGFEENGSPSTPADRSTVN